MDIGRRKKQIGKRLFTLAESWSHKGHMTKKWQLEQIKALPQRKMIVDGSKSVETARAAVEDVAHAIRRLRTAKEADATGAVIRHRQIVPLTLSQSLLTARQNPMLPNMETRLLHRTVRKLEEKHLKAGYRLDQRPHFDVISGQPKVSIETELQWDYYAKSCKYPKKHTTAYISVHRDWLRTVYRRDLAWVDGLFTLSASQQDSIKGCQVYAATWIEQGRGYNLNAVSGYIAVRGEYNYHGKTPQSAVAGVLKKRKLDRPRRISDARLNRLVRAKPAATVTVQDARAQGACMPGIKSFCRRHGLDFEAGKASVSDVYKAYQETHESYAARAILHALTH